MTRKNILMLLPIMFSILLIPNLGMVFADHTHEGSYGGCSGDCIPPTLGKNDNGIVIVEGGFTINEQTFDVESFKQTIPTQIVRENEPVEITLRVFENSGTDYLKHVALVIGNEWIFNGYTWGHLPSAEIDWDKTFQGVESVEINNPNNLITDVNVEVETDDGMITILKFQFTPTMTFDTSNIMVKMWDQNRSYWVNNFYDALEIKSNSFNGGLVDDNLLTTESDTLEEISVVHEEITIEEIDCSAGMVKVYRASNGLPACETPYSASVLIQFGMAVSAQ